MRNRTITIIDALAVVISTALQFGGYAFAVFIFALFISHPLVMLLFKLVLNVLLALFAFSPLSDKFEQWISKTIRNAWWMFRYRPRECGDNMIYYATFNI